MLNLAGSLLFADDQPGQAGPLGLFIILALGAATALLVRSMGRHLRRIPPTFDPPARDDDAPRSPDVPPDESDSAG